MDIPCTVRSRERASVYFQRPYHKNLRRPKSYQEFVVKDFSVFALRIGFASLVYELILFQKKNLFQDFGLELRLHWLRDADKKTQIGATQSIEKTIQCIYLQLGGGASVSRVQKAQN